MAVLLAGPAPASLDSFFQVEDAFLVQSPLILSLELPLCQLMFPMDQLPPHDQTLLTQPIQLTQLRQTPNQLRLTPNQLNQPRQTHNQLIQLTTLKQLSQARALPQPLLLPLQAGLLLHLQAQAARLPHRLSKCSLLQFVLPTLPLWELSAPAMLDLFSLTEDASFLPLPLLQSQSLLLPQPPPPHLPDLHQTLLPVQHLHHLLPLHHQA